eukprot:CAMPEP_0172638546 /NCGR_PEP_ID=MMETSP1068-20121228/214301_1 /TAXON_ID=35684 /ORGANISM="Pseudopedinella elastica, Strain CCMP716" /LENGTH=49 /DNA_ID= /DNA_START= /DNA_END= /DNA_ORIENTATION=
MPPESRQVWAEVRDVISLTDERSPHPQALDEATEVAKPNSEAGKAAAKE